MTGTGGLLWVTAEPPDFRLGGGAIRQAQMLRALRAVFDPVELLVVGRVEDPEVRALADSTVELSAPCRRPARSRWRRRLRELQRVAARLPAEVSDRKTERAVLRAALAARGGGPVSVVHVEHLGLAGIVPPGLGAIRSLDVQNVPSRMAAQARSSAPGRRQRWLLDRERTSALRFQRRAGSQFDVVSVVSRSDAADLGLDGHAISEPAVLVVPNGVDPAEFAGVGSPLPTEPNVVFSGTLDYLPNVDGIVWFARDVWPRVLQHVPGARLSIVGRRPVEEVRRLVEAAPSGTVELHADVPSVVPHLARAQVAVVPVRIGSGSRLKALEAMAAGRPVAATTVGLEGLDVTAGVHALVGDTPGQLAAAVAHLLEDRETAERVAVAGRELVDQRYTWEAIGAQYASELSEVLARRQPA